jgi:hypothetical protein
MFRQGPSTSRERETLLLLREALSEYEINPHMRLANVVKGKLSYTRAMGQYELDFVVQDPATGEVICAIELDDSTHDTEDGRRRDANKNRWMAQARIKLIRIRLPADAITIRERMNQPINFNIPDEITYSFEKRPRSNSGATPFQGAMLSIIAIVLVVWGFTAVIKGVTNNLINKAVAPQLQLQQQLLQQNAARQAEARLQKQQEMEQAEARRRVDAQQPHYERAIVKGKSARECSNGNVINNDSILCMKDHYEMILVSGAK